MESSIRPIDGESGEIIDGKHRYAIEPNCPCIVMKDLTTDAQKFARAILLADARRNMTPERRVASAAIRHLSSTSVGSRSTPSPRAIDAARMVELASTSLRGDGGGRRVKQNGRTWNGCDPVGGPGRITTSRHRQMRDAPQCGIEWHDATSMSSHSQPANRAEPTAKMRRNRGNHRRAPESSTRSTR